MKKLEVGEIYQYLPAKASYIFHYRESETDKKAHLEHGSIFLVLKVLSNNVYSIYHSGYSWRVYINNYSLDYIKKLGDPYDQTGNVK